MIASARSSYLLVLNAAEGLLQLVLAEAPPTPDHGPAHGREQSKSPCRKDAPSPALPAPSAPGVPLVPLCAQEWHAPSQGAELLVPALHEICARLKLSPADIDRIACVRGPGSFTGIRLTLTTAAGMVRATGARQAGLEYLRLLAQGAAHTLEPALRQLPEARLWVITHARRNLVHVQGFCPRPACSALTDILVCTPEEALGQITLRHAQAKGSAVLLGSGLSRNRTFFEAGLRSGHSSAPFLLLPPSFDSPLASTLLAAASALVYTRDDISPLYVRPCDAEENLDRIAVSLRLDPVAARRKLAEVTGAGRETPERS